MTARAYVNAHIIDPATSTRFHGSLVTKDGLIQEVGESVDTTGIETVDCAGYLLTPGFIDMRAHAVDEKAAVAGGVTTVILQPNQSTIIDADAAVERIMGKAQKHALVKVRPMGAATKSFNGEQITEVGQMMESGAVAFTDCTKAVSNSLVMRRLLEYATYFNALIVQFAEDPALGRNGVAHECAISSRLGLPGIPAAAEVIQIDRDIRLAELTGARLHFALVSSRSGLEAIRQAKAKGLAVTCSTAPHYLHLNTNAIEGYRTFAKVSPPLRDEEDRRALIAGLGDGTIDTLVSDHCPQSADSKRLPFEQASSGIAGFETMLPLTLAMVHSGDIDLMAALRALTSTPAALLGLDCGCIATGTPADLVLFDMDKPYRFDRSAMRAAAKNSPFDTLPLQGQIVRTILGGHTVFKRD